MSPRKREQLYGSPIVLLSAVEGEGMRTAFPSSSATSLVVVISPVDGVGRLMGKERVATSDASWDVDGSDHCDFHDVFCLSEVRCLGERGGGIVGEQPPCQCSKAPQRGLGLCFCRACVGVVCCPLASGPRCGSTRDCHA